MGITTAPLLGFDPLEPSTVARFTLGQVVTDNNSTWQYVQAAAGQPKVAGLAYPIPPSYISGAALTTTGSQPSKIGIAPVAIPALSFGWFIIQGTIPQLQVLANCLADVPLFATATAGNLDDGTFAIANLIPGLYATAGVGASPGLVPAFASVELFRLGA